MCPLFLPKFFQFLWKNFKSKWERYIFGDASIYDKFEILKNGIVLESRVTIMMIEVSEPWNVFSQIFNNNNNKKIWKVTIEQWAVSRQHYCSNTVNLNSERWIEVYDCYQFLKSTTCSDVNAKMPTCLVIAIEETHIRMNGKSTRMIPLRTSNNYSLNSPFKCRKPSMRRKKWKRKNNSNDVKFSFGCFPHHSNGKRIGKGKMKSRDTHTQKHNSKMFCTINNKITLIRSNTNEILKRILLAKLYEKFGHLINKHR